MTTTLDRFLYAPATADESRTPGWRARKRGDKPIRCRVCRCLLALGRQKEGTCFICERKLAAPLPGIEPPTSALSGKCGKSSDGNEI